jgi:hypothetical protein
VEASHFSPKTSECNLVPVTVQKKTNEDPKLLLDNSGPWSKTFYLCHSLENEPVNIADVNLMQGLCFALFFK